jgi:large subunit ribosomal protein L25
MNEVEVTCLPRDLPEFIEVDLGDMQIGDTVHLSDVKFPQGVEPTIRIDEEHDPVVAVARHVKEEVEEAPVAEEGIDVPAVKQDEGAEAGGEGEE